jgi:hypothetical protein
VSSSRLRDRIVDPAREDFIKALVEIRIGVKRARDAQAKGTIVHTRLDAIQKGIKKAANSSAYGTPIEMNVGEYSKKIWTRVYLPSGGYYRAKVERVEDPGTWFHPLVSTLVAGGGRLLLAAAMRLVRDAGGSYAISWTRWSGQLGGHSHAEQANFVRRDASMKARQTRSGGGQLFRACDADPRNSGYLGFGDAQTVTVEAQPKLERSLRHNGDYVFCEGAHWEPSQ